MQSRLAPYFPSPLLRHRRRVAGDVEVTVDATQQFQTIEGFGVTARLFSDLHLIFRGGGDSANAIQISDAAKNEILDRLFNDLSLTRLRPIYDARGIEAA